MPPEASPTPPAATNPAQTPPASMLEGAGTQPNQNEPTNPTPGSTSTDEPAEGTSPKTAGTKPGETSPAAADALTLDQIPMPEGVSLDKDNPLVPDFLNLVNNKDLSPKDRGAAMVALYGKVVEQLSEQNTKAWMDLNNDWQKQLITEHTEPVLQEKVARIGGLLNAYDAEMKAAHPAVGNVAAREYGKELREAATLTGAGNNPAFFNFISWIADQLGEGRPLAGKPAGDAQQDRASRLFPNQTK